MKQVRRLISGFILISVSLSLNIAYAEKSRRSLKERAVARRLYVWGGNCLQSLFSDGVPSQKNLSRAEWDALAVSYHKIYSREYEARKSRQARPNRTFEASALFGLFRVDRKPEDTNLYRTFPKHQEILYSLTKGDRIRSGGEVLTLSEFLGADSKTQYFSIEERPGWVLQVPTEVDRYPQTRYENSSHIRDYQPYIQTDRDLHLNVIYLYYTYRDTYYLNPDLQSVMVPLQTVGDLTMTKMLGTPVTLQQFVLEISAWSRDQMGLDAKTALPFEPYLKLSALASFFEKLQGKRGLLIRDLDDISWDSKNAQWLFTRWMGAESIVPPPGRFSLRYTSLFERVSWNLGKAANDQFRILLNYLKVTNLAI